MSTKTKTATGRPKRARGVRFDDAVLRAVTRLAKRDGGTFSATVNDLLAHAIASKEFGAKDGAA